MSNNNSETMSEDKDASLRGAIGEEDRCEECEELPELIEEASVNPLTGMEWDRYKCPCEQTTVRVPHE